MVPIMAITGITEITVPIMAITGITEITVPATEILAIIVTPETMVTQVIVVILEIMERLHQQLRLQQM